MADKVMTITDISYKGGGVFEFLLTSEDDWTEEEIGRFKGIEVPLVPPPPEP